MAVLLIQRHELVSNNCHHLPWIGINEHKQHGEIDDPESELKMLDATAVSDHLFVAVLRSLLMLRRFKLDALHTLAEPRVKQPRTPTPLLDKTWL
jgi:hypothetical protein